MQHTAHGAGPGVLLEEAIRSVTEPSCAAISKADVKRSLLHPVGRELSVMHFFGAGAPFEMRLLHIFPVAVKYRETCTM